MATDDITSSSSSNKMKFACRFLRALSKMRKPRPSSPSSSSICARKRSERIKMAAYWCMARAVGSSRAWSRAILAKPRSRAAAAATTTQHHHHVTSMMMMMRRRRRRKISSIWLGKNNKKKKSPPLYPYPSSGPSDVDDDDDDGVIKSQANKLRQLVPGGKSMDICSLLEETAHFVTCLHSQVHIMRTIAHHYSN